MHTRDQSAWGTDDCGKERNIKSCHMQRPIIVFAEAFHGIVHSFMTMLLLRPCSKLIYLDGFVFGSSSICLPPVCCDSRPATVVRVAGSKLRFAQQYQESNESNHHAGILPESPKNYTNDKAIPRGNKQQYQPHWAQGRTSTTRTTEQVVKHKLAGAEKLQQAICTKTISINLAWQRFWLVWMILICLNQRATHSTRA